jgi:hypothetical protein
MPCSLILRHIYYARMDGVTPVMSSKAPSRAYVVSLLHMAGPPTAHKNNNYPLCTALPVSQRTKLRPLSSVVLSPRRARNYDPIPEMDDIPDSTLRTPVASVSSTASSDTHSTTSSTVVFNREIDLRDGGSCVVCYHGVPGTLDYCHIVPHSAHPDLWEDLKRQGYIPRSAWNHGREPQNVISLCKSHHAAFATWQFYVRFVREVCLTSPMINSNETIVDWKSTAARGIRLRQLPRLS